jgi:hypothetical protein
MLVRNNKTERNLTERSLAPPDVDHVLRAAIASVKTRQLPDCGYSCREILVGFKKVNTYYVKKDKLTWERLQPPEKTSGTWWAHNCTPTKY